MKSIIRRVKVVEKKTSLQKNRCIICGNSAEYVMKNYEINTYCRECALSSFKHLNYLQKITKG